jgi:hypothetical protein
MTPTSLFVHIPQKAQMPAVPVSNVPFPALHSHVPVPKIINYMKSLKMKKAKP